MHGGILSSPVKASQHQARNAVKLTLALAILQSGIYNRSCGLLSMRQNVSQQVQELLHADKRIFIEEIIMNEKMTHLTTMELFQDLSQEDQDELNLITTMTTVRKGRIFYRPEDAGEVIFILKKGTVQLYRISAEGNKLVIYTLGDSTLFGEMSLLGQRLHNTFAEAITDCTICVMDRSDLERLILKRPRVALRILEITGSRLRETEEQLESLAFKSIPERLSSLLLRLAGDGDEVAGLTHQDLAEMIGTYRETTTQTLNDMKAQGILQIGRRRLAILNKNALRQVAKR